MSAGNKRKKDQAGLNDGGTPAPATRWVLSPIFNDSTGDVELRSVDGTRFLLHLSNLAAGSKTFEDMTAVGQKGEVRAIIQLEETAKTLELVFQFFYPKRMSWQIKFPRDIPILVCLDKYEIWRGLDLIEQHMRNITNLSMTRGLWPYAYGFFSHFKTIDSVQIQQDLRSQIFSHHHRDVNLLAKSILNLNLPTVLQFDMNVITASIEKRKTYSRREFEIETTKFLVHLEDRGVKHSHNSSELLSLIRSWDNLDKFRFYGRVEDNHCDSCQSIAKQHAEAYFATIRSKYNLLL